jgi:transcriptional regulator with XRE-family HTH domain
MNRPRRIVLGRNVRRLRAWYEWTEAKLAQKAGVPTSLVLRIERSQANPRLSELEALARGLKVNVLMLLDPLTPLVYVSPAECERFWRKVTKGAPNECWIWRGAKKPTGYASVRHDDHVVQGHRIAYAITAPLPAHWTVEHTCGNGKDACVNPRHLEAMPIGRNLHERDLRQQQRKILR